MNNTQIQQGLHQVRCEKHDLVTVTQTTTTTIDRIDKETTVSKWLQCKNCSFTIPLPEQKLNQ